MSDLIYNEARGQSACGEKIVFFDDKSQKWYAFFCPLEWDHESKHEIRVQW